MKEIIDVWKMVDIPSKTRINILIQLWRIINMKYSANITEELLYFIIQDLDKNHPSLETYKMFIK